jgi:MFS family permease
MLVKCPIEQVHRPQRNHLHILRYLLHHRYLDGCCQQVSNGRYETYSIKISNIHSWVNLLIARFALGFAVGAKSSTTPVYAAESAPKTIRGALTMMWQMWTAFGIMLGFVVSVAFQNTTILGENSQWRWMLGSTSIPPLIVCLQVYFCPESPRW